MKVLITGASGTGKSSVCKELKKRGYSTLDIDDKLEIRGWYNKKTGKRAEYTPGAGQDWVEEHEYLWDKEQVGKFLDESPKPVFVCGVVSNLVNSIYLFDKIILLRTSPDMIRHRLTNRDNHPFGKEESEVRGILNWQPKFDAEMIENGAIPIDSNEPVESTVEKIISSVL